MLDLIGLQEDLVGRTCARVLENRDGNDLSATAVVFPSKRFGFFLRQELAAGMEGNFFPPAMFPVEAFFETLFRLNFPGIRVLDELEAAHALYESAQTVFASGMYGSRRIGDFSSFLPWAQKVLAALEEILSEGGETEGINWESYGEFTKLGEYHQPYKEFIQSIPALIEHLRQSLQGQRQATKGMTWRQVADLAEKGELQVQAAGAWILSGFNAANSCERKLFRFLLERHQALLILRTDPKALGAPRSPFHLQAETIAALGLELPAAMPASRAWNDLAGRVTLHPCDGVESEAFHAFSELQRICRGRSEEELRKVAVLLPSPATLIPFVQGAVSRFDQDLSPVPFNITLGYPLERTPMMQLLNSMLAVLENTAAGGIAAQDYLQLVRHPYVKISGERSGLDPLKRGIHILEDIINDRNLTRFTIHDLVAELAGETAKREMEGDAGLAAAIHSQVDAMHGRFIPQGIDDFASLLAFLRRAIESVGSSGNRKAHMFLNEYTAAALAALEELQDFSTARRDAFQGTDWAGMAALVRAHFRGRTIRFEGSPLKGVQVMGPLEFRGLSFDDVLVLDALEGILPGTAKYDPILPADIRAVFKIRDHGDWEKVYTFNFFAMLGAADRVHIFFPRNGEEGRDRERSRFIERIVYEVEKQAGSAPRQETAALRFSLPGREFKKARKTKAVRDKLEALALSPSSLEAYVSCPLQFYFSKIIGLQEREELAGETEGGSIGTIAHKALNAFYSQYGHTAALTAAGDKALDADLERFIHAAFQEYHFDPTHGLERIRAWTLLEQLRRFVREDRERMAARDIRVGPLEEWLSGEFPVPGRQGPVKIRGRLDRCETQGDWLRVIDYKTGSFKFSASNMLKIDFDTGRLAGNDEGDYLRSLDDFHEKYQGMQLLLYLLLLAKTKEQGWDRLDGAFVLLRNEENFFKPLFPLQEKQELGPGGKAAVMEAFRGDLEAVLADLFTREYFLPNPGDERHCSYCPFRLPCGNL
jgi:ATP-dependent helicase/nuclease subunit B